MKTINNVLSILALTFIMITFSCRKFDNPWNGGGGGNGGGTTITYKLSGVFKDFTKLDGCRWVFEAKDGKRYEVAKWPASEVLKPDVEANIEMKYSTAGNSVCMVGAPIDILAISYAVITPPLDCKKPALTNTGATYNTVTIQKVWQEGNYLKMSLGYSGCNFDPKPINLYWDGNVAKTNPASASLNLINQPAPQNCEAYFTAETCFDISVFKTYGTTVNLSLEGYKGGPVTVKF